MSRRSRVVEEDFDDDEKVEYLDCDETGMVSNAEQGARTPRRDKASARFKPLFQQKRYKGDLEAEKYSELFDIEELVNKAAKRPAMDDGFADQPVFEAMSSPISKKNPNDSNRRETPASYVQRGRIEPQAVKSARDVADDRPAHWNRLRMAPARTAGRSNKTARGVPAANSGAPARPVRPIQIPKPKALPAPTVTPAAPGNGHAIPTAVSFKPSWMTSARTTGVANMHPNSGSSSTMRTAAGRPGTMVADSPSPVIPAAPVEDIQDDAVSPVRPFATPARSSMGLQFSSGASQLPTDAMDDGTGGAYTRLSLEASAGVDRLPGTGNSGVLFLSPERPQSSLRYDYGLDSSERGAASGGALHRTASARGGSKARPGSLKAKLLKVQRDGDAAENRIANVPVDRTSRAVDLQDPRQRAVRYIDVEVVAVMEDRAAFKVVRLEVMGVWSKGGDVGPSNPQDAPIGGVLLGYFKPDSCTGQGRGLAVGVRLRVYDGLVVNGGPEARLLCTGCWEPLADG